MTSVVVRILLPPIFLTLLAAGQRHVGFPQPPQPSDRQRMPAPAKPAPVQRIDPLQLQREARELADLAQTVPLDVDKVSHGLLPKDAGEKLKRIEKLAKRLRTEMRP
jgi:hypothetical protein